MSRAPLWKIADLIDFEYLLAGEARDGQEKTEHPRGREFFENEVRPRLKDGTIDSKPAVFRAWLEARRALSAGMLPGGHFETGWQILVAAAIFFGLILGGSVTAALLHYRGDFPVNVSWFLACTVGVQMVVLVAAAVVWFLRATTELFTTFRPLQWLFSNTLWVLSTGLRRLPGEQRDRVRACLAAIGRRREIYGSLAVWPFVVVTQFFAVAFNVGILALLAAHLAFTDIDFGWQSSFIRSPEAAHRIVSGIATPWKWYAPHAHPTLPEIVASHFEYKEGLAPLSKTALKSWWPFLGYTVACYGLLVRGALLLFAGVKMRRSSRGLKFDHEGCNTLYRQLTGPIVRAQDGTATLEIPHTPAPATHHVAGGDCIALISTDADVAEDQLANHVRGAFGWRVTKSIRAQIDHPSGNPDALAALAERAAAHRGVIVVVRAKRAPIKAIALFLTKITATAHTGTEVVLLLAGTKTAAGFAAVAPDHLAHWRNFIAIHGLRVSLETWSAG